MQGLTWFRPEEAELLELLRRWTVAYSRSAMCHLREDGDLRKELEVRLAPCWYQSGDHFPLALWLAADDLRILCSASQPLFCNALPLDVSSTALCSVVSHTGASMIDPSIKYHLKADMDALSISNRPHPSMHQPPPCIGRPTGTCATQRHHSLVPHRW